MVSGVEYINATTQTASNFIISIDSLTGILIGAFIMFFVTVGIAAVYYFGHKAGAIWTIRRGIETAKKRYTIKQEWDEK